MLEIPFLKKEKGKKVIRYSLFDKKKEEELNKMITVKMKRD